MTGMKQFQVEYRTSVWVRIDIDDDGAVEIDRVSVDDENLEGPRHYEQWIYDADGLPAIVQPSEEDRAMLDSVLEGPDALEWPGWRFGP